MKYGALVHSNLADHLSYDPIGGMGFLHGVVIDAHFSEKGSEGRLWKFLQDTQNQRNGAVHGLGVDENTALVCEGEVCRVLGTRGVWGVNVGQSVMGGGSMMGVKALYITQGDILTLNDWRVFFGSQKKEIEENNNTEIETNRF